MRNFHKVIVPFTIFAIAASQLYTNSPYLLPRPILAPPPFEPTQSCCSTQTITVYGTSTIQANPDTATLNAQITVNGNTVSQAIAELSTQATAVISILTANGLNSSNY